MNTTALLSSLQTHFKLNPADARLLIVGLGATGYSAAQFLQKTPIKFAVIDSRSHPPLIDSLREQMPDVAVFCGGFDQAALDVATHLLENPGQYLLRIGGLLRKLSLDELPNLINIIKGEMVFVGPRPALYNQDDLMALRLAAGVDRLKPGITGWAQITGRDEISIEKKVHLEQEYLYKKSILFDFEIIIKTFTNVLFSKGVSH
jgi:hypothetical protein